ncbi:MAG: creatininase family protein [Brevibacterium aurantiacum]|uniref:Creatininase n=1 Tax=Brevibacterium aurantiacum TaxID=273384 RepID=A0A1D7VZB2_BREAU|nr:MULTISPECIES: creatininase family protein [Brevibacterium]MDN5594129.1 creatininase family protein [Brevibacterium sp.]MDN5771793.1 creatininase family protein [Microlunatus sp.]AOP51808.1 Creatinine amidohydrolase [Brevibacterium aurantiacum]AZL04238.1 creatininase [Brevibacterium aurantiacum]AZL07867.1 creatininase [Brevibacterium aurantiacum]
MTRQSVAEIRPQVRKYGELTSLEVEVAKANDALLILPVGACEQHGDGLPLSTDSIRADHVAMAVAEELAGSTESPNAFVLPSIDYGVSPHHGNLPGTISLDPRTFVDIVTTVAGQLCDSGFTRILVVTGHGGNIAALGVAQQVLLSSHPDLAFAYSPVSGLATETTAQLPRTEVSGHSGESETSQMLAIDDSLVDSSRLTAGATALDELSPRARLTRTKSPSSAVTFDRYADNGVLGDPRTATVTAGEDILGEIIAKLVSYSKEMLRL